MASSNSLCIGQQCHSSPGGAGEQATDGIGQRRPAPKAEETTPLKRGVLVLPLQAGPGVPEDQATLGLAVLNVIENMLTLHSDLSVAALKDYHFGGVELLALSACETGMGGKASKDNQLGQGSEVESFAMLVQYRGAQAVLASLWAVADASTKELTQRFYQVRQAQQLSKSAQRLLLWLKEADALVLVLVEAIIIAGNSA